MKTITTKDAIKTITTHYIDRAFVESHGRETMDIISPTSHGEGHAERAPYCIDHSSLPVNGPRLAPRSSIPNDRSNLKLRNWRQRHLRLRATRRAVPLWQPNA